MAGPRSPSSRAKTLGDWLFRNRQTGRITVAQFPNAALWIFLATVVLRQIVATGTAPGTVVDWAGAVSLAWWALDEVIRGVNPWRRLLGLAVGVVVGVGIANLV